MLDAIHGLPLFIAAGLLLNVTPGPDMLFIVGHAASHGRRAGVLAALGIGAAYWFTRLLSPFAYSLSCKADRLRTFCPREGASVSAALIVPPLHKETPSSSERGSN